MASSEIDMESIPTLKMNDLKIMLKKRGLPTDGKKVDLQERLMEAFEKEDNVNEEDILNVQDEEEEVDTTEKEVLEEPEASEPPPEEEKEVEKVTTKTVNNESKSQTDVLLERSKRFGVAAATDETKKLDRLKRFGATSEEAKKLARAERFGITNDSKTSNENKSFKLKASSGTAVDIDVLKKRAERFGPISSVITKITEKEKLLKRQSRFGAVTDSQEVAEKKRKRAERFGLTSV